MVESIKKCGVVVNKSISPEGADKCFDFVQEADANPRRRVVSDVLRSQGQQANQPAVSFTDSASFLRALTGYLSAKSTHIADWFRLNMRLSVLKQYALGLIQVDTIGGKTLRDYWSSLK